MARKMINSIERDDSSAGECPCWSFMQDRGDVDGRELLHGICEGEEESNSNDVVEDEQQDGVADQGDEFSRCERNFVDPAEVFSGMFEARLTSHVDDAGSFLGAVML